MNNIITQNYCQNVYSSGSAPLIQGNTISSSLTPEKCFVLYTGGLMLYGGYSANYGQTSASPLVIGNIIQNNTTGQSGDGGGDGGPGIAIWGGSPVIQNNIIRNNLTKSGSGGGINIVYGSGISIIQNLIYGNTAGCGGGAIGSEMGSLSPDTYLLIANNTMVGNTGNGNGGYSDCRKTSEVWTAFYTGGGPSIKFVNNIFSANATPALDCGYLQTNPVFGGIDQAHQSLFDHNLLYSSAGTFFASNCFDTSHLNGNLVADPQFVNPATNDYHLKTTSPAIDTGNGSVLQNLKLLSGIQLSQDFDGKPRELDATGQGAPIIDMGAYEFGGLPDGSPTRVVLSSSAYSAAAGSAFTLTASLSSALGIPTGPVTFLSDGKQIGVSNVVSGVATLNNVSFVPGVHVLLATYAGQGPFPAAVSVVIFLSISPYTTSLSLTSSANPSILGQSVTFTAKASSSDAASIPSPIVLTDTTTNTTLATLVPNSSGVATFSTSSLTLGFHSITATYAGDTSHTSASAYVYQQVVNGYPTTTAETSSPNPSVVGQAVNLVATVTSSTNSPPTGSVTFSIGAATLGSAAVVAINSTTATASFSTSSLPVGSNFVVATYVPSGTFAASIGAVTQQVLSGYPTTVSVVSSINPSSINQSVTFATHVAAQTASNGVPTGSVTFSDGGAMLAAQPLDASGNAAYVTSALTRGTHAITATYVPTGSFAASAGTLTQTVKGQDPYTTLQASPTTATVGTRILLTAQVSGSQAPTGTVTFFSGAITLGTVTITAANGYFAYGTLSTSALQAGTSVIGCAYSGDSTFNPGTCNTVSVTLTAAPTALALTSSANPTPALTPATLTAALSSNGQPLQGTVVFTVDGRASPPVTTSAAGLALLPATLTAGSHLIAVSYAATANYMASNATLTEVATPNTTTTTLTAAPNPGQQNSPVTLVATVAAITGSAPPAAFVQFLDGTTLLQTVPTAPLAQGAVASATFTTSTLSASTHSLAAHFAPATADFLPSNSPAVSVVINPSDFAIVTAAPSLTLKTEHHGTMDVTLTSIGGLAGRFTLACGRLPRAATCAWANSTVVVAAGGTASTTVKIDTDVVLGFRSALEPAARPGPTGFPRQGLPLVLAGVLPLALFGVRRRRLRKTCLAVGMVTLLFAASALSGCGDKYPDHTPPGTYDVTITATGVPSGSSSALTHTAHLSLVVTE